MFLYCWSFQMLHRKGLEQTLVIAFICIFRNNLKIKIIMVYHDFSHLCLRFNPLTTVYVK